VVDRNPGIIDDAVDDPEGVDLGHPTIIVNRARPIAVGAAIEFIDRDHLARFRLG
jgi:hypothetical protein